MPANPFDYASTAQSVHSSLDAAFQAIPPGKRGALLGKVLLVNGKPEVALTVAAHIGGNWELAAGGAWDGQHKASGDVALMDSW